MRTVLVTGPGGAGRTTIAAATALAATRHGSRTLLLSADPGDVLGTAVGAEPARVTEGLWAARIDSGAHFRTELLRFQERAATVLDLLGARGLDGEELTELPGSEQFALLHAVHRAARGGWDVLVVDMPPLRDALATLALPEQLRRYLRRLLPQERQAARALRPMMAQLAGVPMPARWLYETAARRDEELAGVQALIEDRRTTLRLVAEPGPAAGEALRTARAGAALYGLRIDMLVPNRVLPRGSSDPWLATLVSQQRKTLDAWHEEWPPRVSLCEVGHLGREPHGLDDLALLDAGSGLAAFGESVAGGTLSEGTLTGGDGAGAGFGAESGSAGGLGEGLDEPPEDRAGETWHIQDRIAAENLLVWCIPLPGAVKSELALVRRNDELLLTVGTVRRIVPLPSALRRCGVSGAALTDGVLRVRFTPDSTVWPRTH
jgi:arsenite-transporting ATPase